MRSLIAAIVVATVVVACGEDSTTEPPDTPTSALRINEFLASNDGGLLDEDGDASDWIELHNTGPGPQDLAGWYLTDDQTDLTRWALPAVTIQPGGYLVVFASDKDRSNPAGELHTNFRLSAGGEYLGLVQDDGITVVDEYAPSFPPQSSNVSYGHLASGGVGYLRFPTPGAANSEEALFGLNVTPPAGVFTESVVVTLSFVGGGDPTIRYTTDGSEPTTSSAEYDGPFTLTRSTRLRARAFDGAVAGPEEYAFFTEVSNTVGSFESDLPLVIIHTFGTEVPNDDVGAESQDWPMWR